MTVTALNPPRLAPRGPAGSVGYSANYSRQQSARRQSRRLRLHRPLQRHQPRLLLRRRNDAARALSAIPL